MPVAANTWAFEKPGRSSRSLNASAGRVDSGTMADARTVDAPDVTVTIASPTKPASGGGGTCEPERLAAPAFASSSTRCARSVGCAAPAPAAPSQGTAGLAGL